MNTTQEVITNGWTECVYLFPPYKTYVGTVPMKVGAPMPFFAVDMSAECSSTGRTHVAKFLNTFSSNNLSFTLFWSKNRTSTKEQCVVVSDTICMLEGLLDIHGISIPPQAYPSLMVSHPCFRETKERFGNCLRRRMVWTLLVRVHNQVYGYNISAKTGKVGLQAVYESYKTLGKYIPDWV